MSTLEDTRTLLDLVSDVRDVADLVTSTAELLPLDDDDADLRFGSTRKVVRAINRAMRQLYNLLHIARGEGRFIQRRFIPFVSTTTDYDLPSDFLELESATWFDGQSSHRFMSQWQPADEGYLRTVGAELSDTVGKWAPYAFRLGPTSIIILPPPTSITSGEGAFLKYVPRCRDLKTTRDRATWAAGWEDWAVYRAAMELNGMQETDTAGLIVQSWAIIDNQIKSLARTRDAAEPPTTQDVMEW